MFTKPLQNIDAVEEGKNAHFSCRLIPVGDPTLKVLFVYLYLAYLFIIWTGLASGDPSVSEQVIIDSRLVIYVNFQEQQSQTPIVGPVVCLHHIYPFTLSKGWIVKPAKTTSRLTRITTWLRGWQIFKFHYFKSTLIPRKIKWKKNPTISKPVWEPSPYYPQ